MSLPTFLEKIGADIGAWAGDALHFVESGASLAWNFVLPFVQALEPIAWAQAVPIIVQAIEDVGSGDLEDLETSVLNKAEALGVTLFKELDSDVVQALIAVVRAFQPKAAVAATPPKAS